MQPLEVQAVADTGETTLRWVESVDGFEALREQWNDLHRDAGQTVFLSHAWLSRWRSVFGGDQALRVLTAWEGDRLTGVLPLAFEESRGGRKWRFMGVGTLTPNHLDLLARDVDRDRLAAGFADSLFDRRNEWDVVELDKLPPDSPFAQNFQERCTDAGLRTSYAPSAVCPRADLGGGWDEYLASRSKTTRRLKGQMLRRFERDNPEAVFTLTTDPAEVDRAFGALVDFHQDRWRAKGHPGAFADARVVDFHRGIIADALEQGFLRMGLLKVGSDIVVVHYDMKPGRAWEAYLSGFDEEWSHYSCSQLLRAWAIEQAAEEGAECFDLLEGQEEWKSSWTTSEVTNFKLSAFSRSLAGASAWLKSGANAAVVSAARAVVPTRLREKAVRSIEFSKVPSSAGGKD